MNTNNEQVIRSPNPSDPNSPPFPTPLGSQSPPVTNTSTWSKMQLLVPVLMKYSILLLITPTKRAMEICGEKRLKSEINVQIL